MNLTKEDLDIIRLALTLLKDAVTETLDQSDNPERDRTIIEMVNSVGSKLFSDWAGEKLN